MNDFLSKCFGFNHMNLIGWIVAGVSLLCVSGYFGYQAVEHAKSTTVGPEIYILSVIAMALLGIFVLLLNIYVNLVIEQLNKQPKSSSNEFMD